MQVLRCRNALEKNLDSKRLHTCCKNASWILGSNSSGPQLENIPWWGKNILKGDKHTFGGTKI